MKKHSKYYVLFITIILVLLIIPFAGMAVQAPASSSAEKRELSPWPDTYTEDGKLNINYMSEMGDYFQDHFALRDYMIMSYSTLKSKTVGSGVQDQVLVGKDGWLFYSGTVDDFLGREQLSERELYATVHNLSLMQQYAEKRGSQFLLAIAPNKNSIYGEYMPYNYLQAPSSNANHLQPLLEQAEIPHAHIFEAMQAADEPMYFERDSHWHNKGAALAYSTMLSALGREHKTYEDAAWHTKVDHMGDIDEMLYIMNYTNEAQYYPDQPFTYTYENDVDNHMDSFIETSNSNAEDCLLLYRDSFGESLVPFFAEEFGQAYFSRLTPYNFANIDKYQPNYVIIQKAERTLIDFVRQPTLMQAPVVQNMDLPTINTQSTIQTATDGLYLKISGRVDKAYIQQKSDIFVAVTDHESGQKRTFSPFYTSNKQREGNSYALYLDKAMQPQADDTIELLVSGEDGTEYIVQSKKMEH